jgi:tetratricopeptide (TPR) repeat protein
VARWLLILLSAGVLWAQQAPPAVPLPPEEDETLKGKTDEYVLNPLQAQNELKIGNYYLKKGSLNAAAKRFEEATKWDPNFADAYLKLGEVQERLRNTAAAQAAFRKYVELAPDAKNAGAIKKKLKTPAS